MVYERTRPTAPNASTLDGVSLDSDNRLPAAQTPTAPTADTISERTAAAGVTVDGVLLKDGGFTTTAKGLIGGEAEIDGALNHDGTTVGFYGVTPATRPAAYTQTYATATRTHANATSSDLTNDTGETPNTTIVSATSSVTGVNTVNEAAIVANFNDVNRNFSDIADQFNKLRADVLNLKQLVNQMIDDDQTLGLKQ